jgi:hypothetical protein
LSTLTPAQNYKMKITIKRNYFAVIWITLLHVAILHAQPPNAVLSGSTESNIEAAASVDFGANQSVNTSLRRGLSDHIGLHPNQAVKGTIQFPIENAGRVIAIEPLDGGRIIGSVKKSVVGADGTFSFNFQAGNDPGLLQVCLRNGSQEIGLRFWVIDSQNPDSLPSPTPAS